jgi:hypothetical protein
LFSALQLLETDSAADFQCDVWNKFKVYFAETKIPSDDISSTSGLITSKEQAKQTWKVNDSNDNTWKVNDKNTRPKKMTCVQSLDLRWFSRFFIRKTHSKHHKFVKVKAWIISFETFILRLLCK